MRRRKRSRNTSGDEKLTRVRTRGCDVAARTRRGAQTISRKNWRGLSRGLSRGCPGGCPGVVQPHLPPPLVLLVVLLLMFLFLFARGTRQRPSQPISHGAPCECESAREPSQRPPLRRSPRCAACEPRRARGVSDTDTIRNKARRTRAASHRSAFGYLRRSSRNGAPAREPFRGPQPQGPRSHRAKSRSHGGVFSVRRTKTSVDTVATAISPLVFPFSSFLSSPLSSSPSCSSPSVRLARAPARFGRRRKMGGRRGRAGGTGGKGRGNGRR